MTWLAILVLHVTFGSVNSDIKDTKSGTNPKEVHPDLMKRSYKDCREGWYWYPRTGECRECPYGTQKEKYRESCEICGNGRYRDRGMTWCEDCPTNSVAGGGSRTCTPCRYGTVPSYSRSYCESCNSGTYRDNSMITCEQCPANKWSSHGAYRCNSCGEGKTPNSWRTECVKCPRGTYKDNNMWTCDSCPSGTMPNPNYTACDGDKYYWKWSPVKRDTFIYFNRENSIEIKTDPESKGSFVAIDFYGTTNWIGAIQLEVSEKPKYRIRGCTTTVHGEIPVALSSTKEKIWRISLLYEGWSSLRILIQCNDVEALALQITQQECGTFTSRYWNDDYTQFKFSLDDTKSDTYRFFRGDVTPEDGNPCPDHAHYCSSGECWVTYKTGENSRLHETTKCLCLIDGRGKGADNQLDQTSRLWYSQNDPKLQYPIITSIQCKEMGSDDRTLQEETTVMCGWFFEERADWNFLDRKANWWSYDETTDNSNKRSKLQIVGTPHDCSGLQMWKIVLIVLSVVVVLTILLFIIWRRRKKGDCGGSSSTHEALPTEIPPQNDSSERGQSPSRSIPTYRECLDGSERIVAENDYITLPTAPTFSNNQIVEAPPPSYQDVQEHSDYYAPSYREH